MDQLAGADAVYVHLQKNLPSDDHKLTLGTELRRLDFVGREVVKGIERRPCSSAALFVD